MQSENQLAAGVDQHVSPGVRLRTAREARGESVHEVAFAIKLSPRQVEALENDDFAALPGMAFVRGFARNYARYLGLDAAPLIAGIERLAGAGAPDLSPIRNAEGDLPAGGGGRQGQFPAGMVVVALLVLLGVGWYFDWFSTEPPPLAELQVESAPVFAPAPAEPTPVAPPEPAAGPAPAASEASPPAAPAAPPSLPPAVAEQTAAGVAAPAAETPAAQASAADAVAGGDQLGFRFGADAWVEVRDSSGTILHAGTNRAGSSRIVQGKPPFRLIVGNSAKVVLEHDGKPVDLAPHTRGSVARLTLP